MWWQKGSASHTGRSKVVARLVITINFAKGASRTGKNFGKVL